MSDWPLVILGVVGSLVVLPLVVYLLLVVRPPGLAGVSMRLVGLVALLPGFTMGALAGWLAARG